MTYLGMGVRNWLERQAAKNNGALRVLTYLAELEADCARLRKANQELEQEKAVTDAVLRSNFDMEGDHVTIIASPDVSMESPQTLLPSGFQVPNGTLIFTLRNAEQVQMVRNNLPNDWKRGETTLYLKMVAHGKEKVLADE